MAHPHFRSEFELPWSEYDSLMALRRVSETSPPASPVILTRRKIKGQKAQMASERTPSRKGSLMAGLVGGDSDSSALTESGDEAMEVDQGSAKPSRRTSVVTGTPTEEVAEAEEEAEAVDSPGKSLDSICPGVSHLSISQPSWEKRTTTGNSRLTSTRCGNFKKNSEEVSCLNP
jgi:MRG-binding protein